jgi:hypothetical protein
MSNACSTHRYEEECICHLTGKPVGRDCLEKMGTEGDNIKRYRKKESVMLYTALISLRTGNSGRLL